MWFDARVTVRFSEKHAAESLRLSVWMNQVVSKLLMGLMMMSIAFLSSSLGSGCTVHDLGFGAMAFLWHALQKTEALNGC